MSVSPFALALADPLGTARGPITERRGFLLTVDVDGVAGIGEAAPLPEWTEEYEECRAALERAAAAADREGALAATAASPAARHAVSLAYADAESTRADVPLYRHLGAGGAVERVPANATVGDADAAETAARVRAAVEAGFDCVKVKAGARDLADDLERLRAARRAAPDVRLRVDVNAAWDRETAATALERVADLGVACVEQPLAASDLDGHAALRGPVPLALDESVARCGLDRVLAADAADRVVLKPMALGGPDRAVAAGERARERGVEPVVTTTFGAVYARTAAVHVAAALAPLPPCGLATAAALESDLAADPAPLAAGQVTVPQRNGNGVPAPTSE